MNNLDIFKHIYKPYKYTIKGKTTIINTTMGDYVIKASNKDLNKLFNYLKSRSFYNYPRIIDDTRSGVVVYEYQSDYSIPKEQKAIDLVCLVSNLHNKTTYFKEVTEDKYKTIYENIKSNIDYLSNYFNNLYDSFFGEIYHSPSHYLFMCNYYKLVSVFRFCQNELDEWYNLIKENKNLRVCVVHNNLSLDHYIKSSNEFLISWDKYIIDTPVLDLVNFYKNNALDINFKKVFDTYNERYPLSEDEKKLFFILVALPEKIELDLHSELLNTKVLRRYFDYIYKTEELIRPYYSSDKEE